MSSIVRVLLLPAAVYASVLIGGGYGTGREIVEFFSSQGFWGGIEALITAVCLFALVLFLSFEYARRTQHFEYQSFFQALIGPFWWMFELLYIALMLLVLAVLGSAASEILLGQFGLPSQFGLLLMLLATAGMVALGRQLLEGLMGLWIVFMYSVFALYFILVLQGLPLFELPVSAHAVETLAAVQSGSLYAFYNLAIVPVLLFAVRDLKTRGESLACAVFVALVVMLPAVLFHLSFAQAAAEALTQPVPVYWMIQQYAPAWFLPVFLVALLGTLVQTGAGLVQGLIERIEPALAARHPEGSLSRSGRAGIALVTLVTSGVLSKLGIISLIAQGYSALAVGFACVFVLPLILRGIPRVFSRN